MKDWYICNGQCGNCPHDGDCPKQERFDDEEEQEDDEDENWYHEKYQV